MLRPVNAAESDPFRAGQTPSRGSIGPGRTRICAMRYIGHGPAVSSKVGGLWQVLGVFGRARWGRSTTPALGRLHTMGWQVAA
jgi:hypothetical protein